MIDEAAGLAGWTGEVKGNGPERVTAQVGVDAASQGVVGDAGRGDVDDDGERQGAGDVVGDGLAVASPAWGGGDAGRRRQVSNDGACNPG